VNALSQHLPDCEDIYDTFKARVPQRGVSASDLQDLKGTYVYVY
jgi:hypothetical protein